MCSGARPGLHPVDAKESQTKYRVAVSEAAALQETIHKRLLLLRDPLWCFSGQGMRRERDLAVPLLSVLHGEIMNERGWWEHYSTSSAHPSLQVLFDFLMRKRTIKICLVWLYGTVPTFNSYPKCVGSPGIIHDRMPGFHNVSCA